MCGPQHCCRYGLDAEIQHMLCNLDIMNGNKYNELQLMKACIAKK